MSLRYIVGRSGSGKTERCMEEITKAVRGKPLIYIVPEQFSLQAEKELIAMGRKTLHGAVVGKASLIDIQVFSFQRLAYWIFSETGGLREKMLDASGKQMLLRKIVYDLRRNLVFFARAANKDGFAKHLAKTISEFYQYGITPDHLEAYRQSVAAQLSSGENAIFHEGLSLKMRDLLEIYKLYRAYLADNYIVADETLDILCDKIDSSCYLEGVEIWVDGFTGFTPQEYAVLGQLLKKADRVTAAFTTDDRNEIPFYEIKITMDRLKGLAQSNGVIMEETLFLQERPRFRRASMMDFLEKNFFSFGMGEKGYAKIGDEIVISSSANSYEEIKDAAEEILTLVRDKGLRYGEIGVATGALANYAKGFDSVLGQYNIPFFIDIKTDILFHPLTEFIRSALEVVARNFSYEAVFRFLKTGLLPMKQKDIDLLENYVLAYGIKGSRWDKPFTLGFGEGRHEGFEEEKINVLRETVRQCLRPFTEGLRGHKKLSVRDFSERVFQLIDDNGILEKLAGDVNGLKISGQIWQKICEIFDKLVEILGQEIMSLTEFVKVVEAGLIGADMGLIPPAQDQVIIGDLERSRFPKIRALLILGVNEGILPSLPEEEGLFSDEERVRLTEAGLELAPDMRRRAFHEDFLIYCGVTRPEEFLYLSYSRGTLEGKALQPSALIAKIKKLFPFLIVVEKQPGLSLSLSAPAFDKMGVWMRDLAERGEIDDTFQALYSWFKASDVYSHRLSKMEAMLLGKEQKEKLASRLVKKLYGKEIITGVSRLEKYVQCPYAYFVRYNLDAEERKIYQVQAVDLGNLFHNVLEEVARLAADQGLSWRLLTREQIYRLVTEVVDRLAPQLNGQVLLSSERYKYLMKRVARIAERSVWALAEHMKRGSFEPLAAELEFKEGGPVTGISVNINDRHKFILTGRIDRIDVLDSRGNKYVKIIDYKSGNTKFDIRDIYFGMQLQLILYADAFIQNGVALFGNGKVSAEILPGGVFYFNINDPVIDYPGEIDGQELDERILQAFKMTGLVLADETVIKGLDENISGQSDIIPVYLKTDGSFGVNSSIAELAEFNQMRRAVLDKIAQIGQEITEGDIPVFPYQKGQLTGCGYCSFKGICQFEVVESENRFHVVR